LAFFPAVTLVAGTAIVSVGSREEQPTTESNTHAENAHTDANERSKLMAMETSISGAAQSQSVT
jgi:hypothetical protein